MMNDFHKYLIWKESDMQKYIILAHKKTLIFL